MNIIFFVAVVAFFATANLVAGRPVITYQDANNAVDFKSEGSIPDAGYYYLGGFSNFNQTTKVYFDVTIDPACTYTLGITLYSTTTAPTATYTNTVPTTVEFHTIGKSLSVSADYPPLSDGLLNARFFYAGIPLNGCSYNVKARSETVN